MEHKLKVLFIDMEHDQKTLPPIPAVAAKDSDTTN